MSQIRIWGMRGNEDERKFYLRLGYGDSGDVYVELMGAGGCQLRGGRLVSFDADSNGLFMVRVNDVAPGLGVLMDAGTCRIADLSEGAHDS